MSEKVAKKSFELKGRKVNMFRCHLDPAIGPKARNAFSKKEYPNWEFELTAIGIYVRAIHRTPHLNKDQMSEHIVPYANVQSIHLIPEEEEAKAA